MYLSPTPASMIMGRFTLSNTVTLTGLCLCFAVLINAEVDISCRGPRVHYEEIGCTPVFETPESKCPEKYNCDHLKNLPVDKCFLNGRTYEIGELLRDEDMSPCHVGCFCSYSPKGPTFSCEFVDCFSRFLGSIGSIALHSECYQRRNATSCCGEQVCPRKDSDRATCIVDGKTYRDGDFFRPAAEPRKHCYCGEGYTGENVEPFCIELNGGACLTMLRGISGVRENCAPVYHHTASPATSCPISYRCQNAGDAVIPAPSKPSDETDSDKQCKIGNLTMNVGDELNQKTYYDSVCVKCVCEVGPIPTCQRISYSECDVSK